VSGPDPLQDRIDDAGGADLTVGDCPVCGRVGVDLHEYCRWDGTPAWACVDEFACADAWAGRSLPRRARKARR
jgi:hypothetical protein